MFGRFRKLIFVGIVVLFLLVLLFFVPHAPLSQIGSDFLAATVTSTIAQQQLLVTLMQQLIILLTQYLAQLQAQFVALLSHQPVSTVTSTSTSANNPSIGTPGAPGSISTPTPTPTPNPIYPVPTPTPVPVPIPPPSPTPTPTPTPTPAPAGTPAQFANLLMCQRTASGYNSSPTAGTTPYDGCSAIASPADSKPAVYDGTAGTIYTDPIFHTQLKRITSQAGMPANGYFPVYAPNQAWNLDGSYMILNYFQGGGLVLMNGNDPYNYIRTINIAGDGVDQLGPIWSNRDRCIFYYTYARQIRTLDVCHNDAIATIGTFNTLTDTQGNTLDLVANNLTIKPYVYCNTDDASTKLASKIVYGQTGAPWGFGVFDLTTPNHYFWFHKLTTPGDLVNTNAPENKRPAQACISPDGDYVEVAWNTPGNYTHTGTEEYDAVTGARISRVSPWSGFGAGGLLSKDDGTHADMGRLANGKEVIYSGFCVADGATHDDYRRTTAYAFDPSLALGCPSSAGVIQNLMPDSAYFSGQWHISGRANIGVNNPMNGYALGSSYNENAVDMSPQVPMGSEIFALKMDNSNIVYRIAHDQVCRAGQYFNEPHATPNRDFTKVLFTSNWRNCTSDGTKTDAYIVELGSGGNVSSPTPPPATPAPDTTPPTISVTGPSSGATVQGTITLSASASDNVGVVLVQFKLDGANIGSALTSAPFTYSWDTTGVANGSHTISAVATDAAGNSATASNVSVTVNNAVSSPPSGSGPSVVQSAHGSGNGGSFNVSLPSPTQAGDLVVVLLNSLSQTPVSFSDNKGSTYTLGGSAYDTVNGRDFAGVYYRTNAQAGVQNFTVTTNYVATSIFVVEISGASVSAPFDQFTSHLQNYDAGTNWSVGPTSATSQANELLIAFATQYYTGNAAWGGSSGWTSLGNEGSSAFVEYKSVSATGAYSAAGTANTGGATIFLSEITTFK